MPVSSSETPVAAGDTPTAARRSKARPDPRPSRLMIGAGAIAALTVIGAGLVRFPVSGTEASSVTPGGATTERPVEATPRVRYIKLKPGQKAPEGARVIKRKAPPPRVVVRRVTVSAPSASRSAPTRPRPVVRTRQSG